jgi:hypothetical protein
LRNGGAEAEAEAEAEAVMTRPGAGGARPRAYAAAASAQRAGLHSGELCWSKTSMSLVSTAVGAWTMTRPSSSANCARAPTFPIMPAMTAFRSSREANSAVGARNWDCTSASTCSNLLPAPPLHHTTIRRTALRKPCSTMATPSTPMSTPTPGHAHCKAVSVLVVPPLLELSPPFNDFICWACFRSSSTHILVARGVSLNPSRTSFRTRPKASLLLFFSLPAATMSSATTACTSRMRCLNDDSPSAPA